MLNTCKVRRNTRTREIDQVVIDRPFTDERANVIYNYYRSIGIPIHLGKEAMRKELKKRGFNVDLEVAALHGSPHRYNKEILVRHEDGTIEYLVGTPEHFPTVPEGATILREFPNGRFRLDKIGAGQGAQTFGWGLYFTDLESIAREYATTLSDMSFKDAEGTIHSYPFDSFKGEDSWIRNLLISTEEKGVFEKISNLKIRIENLTSQIEEYNFSDDRKAREQAIRELEWLEKNKENLIQNANLYKATLHKGKTPDQYTWLEWDKTVSDEKIISAYKRAVEISEETESFKNYSLTTFLERKPNGNEIYTHISYLLGSAKAASLFLLENGVDGVKYPAETISSGATSDTARGFNYVVFDENAITIEEHIQFLSTPSGEVYGFVTSEGEMFLDPDIAGVNTLIHEGAHIQYKVLKTAAERGDVKAQAILNKIQELTAPAVETIFNAKKAQERSSDSMTSADMQTYEEVIRNIPNLTEEQVKATAELLQTITENAAQRAGVSVEEYLKNRRSIYTEKPLSNARAVQLMNVEFSNHSNEQYNVLNQPNQNLKGLAKHPQIVKLGLDINNNEEAWIARYVTKTEEGKRLLGSLGKNPTAEQLRTALEEQFKTYGDKIKGGNEFYITEISDEYIDAQIEKSRAESNSENIHMWEDVKRNKQRYINEQQTLQRQNLSSLYDYYNNAIEYPLAMKLMILDAITKHDYRYNKDKDKIGRSKRGNNTISPHILPNSLFMNKVIEHPLSDKNIIHDYFYESINFKGEKINLQDYKENVHKVEDNGTWYHFTQNRPQDEELFYKMSALSAEYPGAWCTGASIDSARNYIENGDLYIFYDNRINNPSIQLHVYASTAIEIGGLEAGQGIRPEDVEIIDKFKKDNPEINLSDIEDYNRYSRLLLRWQKSDKDVQALSREDVKFLLQATPYYKDNTGNLEKFRKSLTKKDYAYIYNTTEDNVFDTLTNDNISELRENAVILGYVSFNTLELPQGFTIPKGVTFNGDVSFSGATLPQDFTIQEGVTFNGIVDFQEADLTEGFTIQEGVTFNEYVDFIGVILPQNFTIPKGVTFNGQVSFYKAVLPKNFTIQEGATFNGFVNFEMARSTEGFTIQEGATFNGQVGFERARLTEGFTIQEGVTFNESVNFSEAKLPQGFTIPKGVTFNGHVNFFRTALPEGFTIPEGVTFNGFVNFSRATLPQNFTIPEGVTFNGEVSFIGVILPQGFTIPKGVTFNGDVNFFGATLPQGFTIQEGVTFNGIVNFSEATLPQNFTIPEGVTFNGDVNFIRTALPQGFTIPKGVTFNGDVNFTRATLPQNFTIPEGVTFNGQVSFYKAVLPQNFTIQEGVTFNGEVSFIEVILPQNFTIQEGVTFNEYVSFERATLLEGFTIQEGVTFDGFVSFYEAILPEGLNISEDSNSFTITYPDGNSVTHRINQKAGEVLQQDNRGVIVQRGETSLTIFNRNSDITTIIHEKAHEYEHTLTPEEVKVLEEWSGHKQGTVEFSEAFAKGAEKVLYDGTFANKQVENIFTKFARWFQEVIQQAIEYFSDINEMNPEVLSIYRNMMTRSGVVEEAQVQEATSSEEAALPGELLNIINSPAYNQRENETDEQYKERLIEEVYATALGSNGEQYLKDLGFTAQEAKTFLQKVQEFLAEIVDWLRGKKGLQDLSVDEINKLSIREFLDRSTTSMMLGEFKNVKSEHEEYNSLIKKLQDNENYRKAVEYRNKSREFYESKNYEEYNKYKRLSAEYFLRFEDEVGYALRGGAIEGRDSTPERLFQFRGGRGTGHFGSGFYFLGAHQAEPANEGAYYNRALVLVDFKDYELLRVRDNNDGYLLHEALKNFSSSVLNRNVEYIIKERIKDDIGKGLGMSKETREKINTIENLFLYYLEYNSSELSESLLEELDPDNMEFEITYEKENKIYSSRILSHIRDYLRGYSFHDTLGRLFNENQEEEIKKILLGEQESMSEEDIVLLNMEYKEEWISNLSKIISKISNRNYEEVYKNIYTTVKDNIDEYNPDDPNHMDKTTLGTVIIQNLGYNGIDVRGVMEKDGMTGMDNTTFGSVVYDLNKTKSGNPPKIQEFFRVREDGRIGFQASLDSNPELQQPQTSALTPNREVQVYITPATVRNFNEETLRLKELSDEYNKVAKEISQGNLENQERFTILQNEILDTYQEHIQDKVSKIRGVNVNFNQPYLGSWEGIYEPSLNMTLRISPNADTGAISGLLFDIAENTSQDSFILEERSEKEGKIPLTEFDEAGMSHYPQIRVIFDKQLTVEEKSIVAQRLISKGIDDFSIDGDYFIVSIIDFKSKTYGQKKEFYAEKHAAITTLFREDGERVGTNKVKDIQEHIRKSRYVSARNAGDKQSQTRGYDRSDLFEAQSPNVNFQISGEQGGVGITTLDKVTQQLQKTGLAEKVHTLTPQQIEQELIRRGVDSNIAKQVTAWHGSPHSFVRFLLEKIGIGEGAQRFGWGLYFTELEDIARDYYAKGLSKGRMSVPDKNISRLTEILLPNFTEAINSKLDIFGDRVPKDRLIKIADREIKQLKQLSIKDDVKVDDDTLNRIIKDYEGVEIQEVKDALEELRKVRKEGKNVIPALNNILKAATESLDKYYSKDPDNFVTESRPNLYKVTLFKGKDPSEYTWLEWDKNITTEFNDRIRKQAKKEGLLTERTGKSDVISGVVPTGAHFITEGVNGEVVYDSLVKTFGSPKEASLFLLRAGIDGIKYPAESISRGATSDTARGFNYVVFDENAVTIEEHIQFQKKGLGLLPNGFVDLNTREVFLNKETANLGTPIHEFAHLYNRALKQNNPKLYQRGIDLVNQELTKENSEIQEVIDYVKTTQPNLKDEALAEEILTELTGRRGIELLEKHGDKKSGIIAWLKEAFEAIKQMLGLSQMSNEQAMNLTLQEYADAVATDLLRGEELKFENEAQEYFTREADRLPLTLAVFNTKPFQDLQGKQVKPVTIQQLLNKSGIKQIEKDLINQVLSDNYSGQKRINYDEFEATVRANIMPLERLTTTSYADYGMDNLGDGNYGEAKTLILNSPIEHGVTGHFTGAFIASGRKNIKYVPKQLNDNTWIAVEEGHERQANENNIYQHVGIAGTKEAVDLWIIKYDLSQGKIFDNKKYLVYQDAYDQVDNVLPLAGFDTEQEAKDFIEQNRDNYSYNLDYVDEQYLKYRWNLEQTNKGMFGHIRVWQDGQNFYVAELQSDYFQKNNARKDILEKSERNNPFIKQINEIRKNIDTEYFNYKKNLEKSITEDSKKRDAVEVVEISKVKEYFSNYGGLVSVAEERVLSVAPEGTKYVVFDSLSKGLRNPLFFAKNKEEADNVKKEQEIKLLKEYSNEEVYGVISINEKRKIEKKFRESLQTKEDFVKSNFTEELSKIKKLRKEADKYSLNNLSPQEKQFIASQKEWEKRMVREAIKEASLSGATSLRFPTPYTLSNIEYYIKGNTLTSTETGVIVEYLEEDYIILDGSESSAVELMPIRNMEKVRVSDFEELIENGEIDENTDIYDYYLGDIGRGVIDESGEYFYYNTSYRPEGLETIDTNSKENVTKEDFDIETSLDRNEDGNEVEVYNEKTGKYEIDRTQRTVAYKYEQIAEILKQERGEENVEIVTDENGFDWYETKITPEESQQPVVAFQIIGEQGASNLDAYEESSHRLDNLAVAREMEASGKTPKEIRLATGWERGADGLWRYEIADLELKVSETKVGVLEDIVDDEELFNSYSKLRGIDTELNIDESNGDRGIYFPIQYVRYGSPLPEKIIVEAKSIESAREILLHEVQHAIQRIEGFAVGGSQQSVSGLSQDEINEIMEIELAIEEAQAIKNSGEREYESSTLSDIIESNTRIPEYLKGRAKNIVEQGDEEISKFLSETPYNQYLKIAGEVEARNVQTRMNMTPEQRRETLLQETEDVAREDQIVIMSAQVQQSLNTDTQGVQVLEYQGSTLSYKQRVNPITNQPTNQIEIDLLSVPQENRKQGHARELLRRMTEIADSRGQELYLFAVPRDRATTTEGLIKLYKEFGFESISSFLPAEMVRPARRVSQRAEESLPPAETLLTVDLNGVQEYVPADKIITYYSEMGEINYKEDSEGELVMLKTISASPQQEESITYKQLLSIPNLSKEQALEAYKNLYSTDYYDWKNKTDEC